MSLVIRWMMAVLLLVSGLHISAVGAQMQDSGTQTALLSQTVSVSTLLVPEKAWKHYEKALSAVEHNRPDDSYKESTKALEIAPNFAKAYILRATEEIHQQRFDEAIADASAAARIEPGTYWASVIMAGAYNSTHRCKSALLVLDTMRGPEAETWQAKFERARAQIACGNVEAALYWSALLVETAPQTNSDIYIVRADALLLAHRWKEATSEMNKYLQSKSPLTHRDEVLALLRDMHTRLEGEKNAEVASR